MSLDRMERKISIDDHKFYFLDICNIDNNNNARVFKCIFKSAKIHHRPMLINESNLNERDNPKEYTEGECEKTHIVFKVSHNQILAVVEDRKFGVSFSRIFNYLNIMRDRLEHNFQGVMTYKIIMQDNFLDELNNMLRVSKVTIYRNIEYHGNDFINFTANDIQNLDKETVEFTAKRRRNIKSVAQRIFNSIGGVNEIVRNIRIEGINENGNRTLNLSNFKKTASFETEIDSETGTVNSEDIFSNLLVYIMDM